MRKNQIFYECLYLLAVIPVRVSDGEVDASSQSSMSFSIMISDDRKVAHRARRGQSVKW